MPQAEPFARLSYDTDWKSFRRVVAALKIHDYTMKDHRHTWIGQALKDGIGLHPVAQQAGHKDPTMILKVYGRHISQAEAYQRQNRAASTAGQYGSEAKPGSEKAQQKTQQQHSVQSGGGEIRTPVLRTIFRSVYARVPSIDFSGCWPTGRPHPDESAEFSPADGRRAIGPARICVT